jgi:hypothetical protein
MNGGYKMKKWIIWMADLSNRHVLDRIVVKVSIGVLAAAMVLTILNYLK